MKYSKFLRPLGILACTAFLFGVTNSTVAAGIFSVGDKVSAIGTINVRTASSTSAGIYGRQYLGATGIVKEVSTKAVDGYWWYKVDYSTGVDGWSIQDYLKLYAAPVANDIVKPTAPTNLATSTVTASRVNLSWTASTDAVGVTGYKIYRNSVEIGTSVGTTYSDTTVVPSHTYSYYIIAYDAAGNLSLKSNTISPKTPATTGALFQTGNIIVTTSNTNVRSTPSIYGVVLGSKLSGTRGTIVSGPVIANGYSWWQVNYNGGPNGWSIQDYLEIYTAPVANDIVKPTAPTHLATSTVTTSKVDLSWTASTDAVGVTGYKIYRNSVQIGTSVSTTYSDTTIVPSHSYSYYVMAYDAAGNLSLKSNTISATTGATTGALYQTGDTVMTTSNTNVRSTPSIYGTVLTSKLTGARGTIVSGPVVANGYNWWQVTYNGGPTGWSIQDCLKSYTVAVVSTDKEKPTTPTNLTASTVTSSRIGLSWTAATDNVGVTRYKIYRDNILKGTSVGTTYADTTVTPSHTYTYYITAYDAAGNASEKSNTISQTSGVDVNAVFATGNRVSAISSANIRSAAGIYATVKGRQAIGINGTILSGPISADGYKWWEVNFDSGFDGWVIEIALKKI